MCCKGNTTLFNLTLSAALILVLSIVSTPAALAAKVAPQWESIVKQANIEVGRGRYPQALKGYKTALSILENQGAYDIRTAVVMKNIARMYRSQMKQSAARLWDGKAAIIYQNEIDENQLGSEYLQKETPDLTGQRLRPACPLCHENHRVIPIHFGPGSGYDGAVPPESDVRFNKKPATKDVLEERWYCKNCQQMF